MPTEEQLTARTIKIIEAHGHIFLKKDGWYLSGWTNIAAGPDHVVWGRRPVALEFFNLQWARTIAPLYKSKVVVVYPKKKVAESICYSNPISAGTGGDPSYDRKADGSK